MLFFDINSKHLHLNRGLILLILLLCFSVFASFGQNMSIASFKMDEADQTANVEPTMKRDLNGDKCALIKIVTTQKNFAFDVGSLGITETEWQNSRHPGEIWLYVPNGVMKISIQHPQFGTIKDYDLGSRLKKGRTYVMVLTSDQVNTLVVDYENSQILDVNIFPSDAELFINGLKQNLDYNGHVSLQLPFGTHNYRVAANNYHTEESQVIINDKENKHTLSVKLKQAFGYLNVNSTSESKNGELFIDDIRVGTLPISQFPLKSGLHRISVNQKLYLPYTETIAMTDSAIVTITPILKPNYAEYEIFVDGDKEAQIYDNGELLGTGRWKGLLDAGEHIIEAKKISHTTTTQKIKVIKDTPRKLSISKPMPIYGSLEIKTQPSNAKVYIDGNSKESGYTDFINSRLLIGPHHIKIVLAGHKTEEFDIVIKEGETERINQTLTDYCNATIYSNPNANISIDGKIVGRTPFRVNKIAGDYHIAISAHGYTTYSKKVRLDGTTQDMTIKLQRNYTRPNEFYLQIGYNPFLASSITFGIGFFVKNFNIETNCMIGLKNSESIFWSRIDDFPVSTTYNPYIWDLKFGYGIRLGSRIRLTPQLGVQYVGLKETVEELDYAISDYYYPPSTIADGANAMSLSIGTRFNIALSPSIGVSITPGYNVAIYKSEGYEVLSKTSNEINKYVFGFGGLINLNLYF